MTCDADGIFLVITSRVQKLNQKQGITSIRRANSMRFWCGADESTIIEFDSRSI